MRALATPIVVIVAAAATLAATAVGRSDSSRSTEAGELVVALSFPGSAGLQAGAVRGDSVVFARGFEVEVARAIARKVERTVRFVHRSRAVILAPGPKEWDIAVAQLGLGSADDRHLDLSRPYLTIEQAVLVGRGVRPPRSLAELRRAQVCAKRGTSSAATIRSRVRPRDRALLAGGDEALLRLLQTSRCDAALVEITRAGALLAARPGIAAPAGRITTRVTLAVGVQRGDPLITAVDVAIEELARDGTLAGLTRRWIGIDPGSLRRLA